MKRVLLNLVVSDTHCGSDVGLMPPTYQTGMGNEISHGENFAQKWLWREWVSIQERAMGVIGRDPFILTINGDAIEGIHHRSAEMVSQKWEEHLEIAEQCLLPLSQKANRVMVVRGTECHTQNLEQALALRLGAREARDKWLYRVNGCLVDAAHHMGTTGRRYLEGSGMSIHMGNAQLNYANAGHEVPRVFLRGHRHAGGYFQSSGGVFCVTGAFQFLTRHGKKVVTDSIPEPSMILLDWRGVEEGGLPRVHEFRSKPPQDDIEEVL